MDMFKKNPPMMFCRFRAVCVRLLCMMTLLLPSYVSAEEKIEENLEEVEVSVDVKHREKRVEELPVSSSTFSMANLESGVVFSSKDIATFVPNFHLPDYGSQITSSIYVRGFGTRIEQPVVGMIVDNVPILNKNAFDMDLFDLQRVEFLRGPQGTLYGRNTMCGLVNIHTLSPFSYQGTRLSADYSTGNTARLKASLYRKPTDKFAFSIAANAQHTDGLFRNTYKDELCDPSNSLSLRNRLMWRPSSSLSFENNLSLGVLNQGGYAYAKVEGDGSLPVSYNDECSYERFNLNDGFVLSRRGERMTFSSVTSYQFLNDDMRLDQDFQPSSIFTLEQRQREHVATEEVIFQSQRKDKKWNWKTGAFAFLKHNDMTAPVTFKRDGIDQLILSNANNGIHHVFPDDQLAIREDQFVVNSEFDLPTYGFAAYHQSEFRLRRWTLTMGLRLDYEKARMTYDNDVRLNYLFTLFMNDYKPLVSRLNGEAEKTFFEVLPKLSVQYDCGRGNHLYAYAAKGYKAGGFNTQIFSDILQNALMNDMMRDLGVSFDNMGVRDYDPAKAISYDPEYCWTYELGGHFKGRNINLTTDFALFYIDAHDQQLTVFPAGKSTGRMMTNAGRSRSCGAELSMNYKVKNLNLTGSYGYTNAQFVDYNDGNHRYDGNYVPYSPLNSVSLQVLYTFYLNKKLVDQLEACADWQGVGKIYWDEANEVSQRFYSLFGLSLALKKNRFTLKGWCKNLSDARYDTFYFVSMGNRFCQVGKPRRVGVTFCCELK